MSLLSTAVSNGAPTGFSRMVTNVLSPPYSRLFPGHKVPSFDQAGYATQLHRPLASTILGAISQHFLQEKDTLYQKVKPLSYFCQEMPPAIVKMGRYREMRTQPIMPPTTIMRMGLMALVRFSVAESTSAW